MKLRTVLFVMVILVVTGIASHAFVRTYEQFKDVSVNEKGKVSQSSDKEDLFEFKYDIDTNNNKVTRISIRRLDEQTAKPDATVYTIKEIKKVFDSPEGRGGFVFIAVSTDGAEIIELGGKFAYSTRTGMFSQVITGVYKRVYTKEDHKGKFRPEKQ